MRDCPSIPSSFARLCLSFTGRLNFERLLLFHEHPGMLATMVAVLALWVVPMSALRWWLLLRAIGLAVTPNRAFLLTWIGSFFNMTLPGAVTGDVVKGYYVIREQEAEGRTRAFMTLLIDRFVGLFGLIVMAFLALVTNWDLILGKVLSALVLAAQPDLTTGHCSGSVDGRG